MDSRNDINKNKLSFPAAGTTGYINAKKTIYAPDGGFHLLYENLMFMDCAV